MLERTYGLLSIVLVLYFAFGFQQEEPAVFETRVNGVTIAGDEDLRGLIISSATGVVEVTEGDRTFTVRVKTDAELAQEIPAGVSDEEYIALRKQMLRDKFAAVRAVPRKDKLSPQVLAVLNGVIGRGSELQNIAATSEQLFRLRKISREFDKETQEINQKFGGFSDSEREKLQHESRTRLYEEVANKMTDVLLPHQLEVLANWSPAELGIIKTLTDTPVGEIIGLSDEDQKRLRRRTDKAVEELKQKVAETRSEIMKLYEESLTETQKKQLGSKFGDLAEESIYETSVSNFIRIMDFDLEEKEK